MRLLARNLQSVYYSLYQGKQPILDEHGYETGEMQILYSEPVEIKGSLSASAGTAQTEVFGNLESYDRVLTVSDMNCPIDESSILYVDATPTTESYDYKVARVSKSLNYISYALKKVTVNAQ